MKRGFVSTTEPRPRRFRARTRTSILLNAVIIQLSGLAPLRKQVARLRTGPAAPRRLHLCSPTRTEVGAPAGERRLAASEDLRRKGLKQLTHTRSDEIRRTTTLERVEPHTSEEQLALEPQSFCKHGSEQNTCPLRLRTHTSQEIFLFLFALREGGHSSRLTS